MKAREVKRAKLVAKYAEKRAALKQIVRTGDPADAFEAAQSHAQSPESPYVEQAIGIIHRKYAQEISQSTVADAIGISASYLSRLFKEDLNIGFSDFLCAYRIEKAKEVLKENRYSNKEIARMTGFQDDAYFARIFKRYTGMTPKEYRKTEE